MTTTMIADGTYTHADLTAMKSRQPAWSGTLAREDQERLTRELHDFARSALAELEQAQTYAETEGELAVRVEGGEVVEIVTAE